MRSHVHPIVLDIPQRAQLEEVIRHGESPARRILRAHILLKADEGPGGPGWTDTAIAQAFSVSRTTRCRVRHEFARDGAGVIERRKPRGTRVHKLDGAQEARLVALTCSAPPQGRARWTLRLLAERFVLLDGGGAVSHEHIRHLLKKTHSSPG